MTGRTVFTEFWQLFSCRAEYSIISNHCADSGSYYLIERPTHVFWTIATALCACKFDSIANKFEEKNGETNGKKILIDTHVWRSPQQNYQISCNYTNDVNKIPKTGHFPSTQAANGIFETKNHTLREIRFVWRRRHQFCVIRNSSMRWCADDRYDSNQSYKYCTQCLHTEIMLGVQSFHLHDVCVCAERVSDLSSAKDEKSSDWHRSSHNPA